MFGVVPKKIWGKLMPSDENNLIKMETNLFLVRANGTNILLDTGLGDCITPSEKKIYAASGETTIESSLKQFGLGTNDINYVILTHLHTDHAAGAVKNENGQMVPRFATAKYFVQKMEWDDAVHPNERTAAVYIVDRLMVLQNAGQLELVDGDTDILPGIKVVRTGGHTPGHQGVEISSENHTVVYYADIVPSQYHIRIPYVAAVDLDPLTTMAVKRKLVERLLHDNMAIAFDHDTEIKIGRLEDKEGKILVHKIE
ncbi:Beta-lactamase protein [Candidatus Zixiibacteriota bacterium]|nr:Beta-lactamase protein [candidate division Zixibacteria bacterium]